MSQRMPHFPSAESSRPFSPSRPARETEAQTRQGCQRRADGPGDGGDASGGGLGLDPYPSDPPRFLPGRIPFPSRSPRVPHAIPPGPHHRGAAASGEQSLPRPRGRMEFLAEGTVGAKALRQEAGCGRKGIALMPTGLGPRGFFGAVVRAWVFLWGALRSHSKGGMRKESYFDQALWVLGTGMLRAGRRPGPGRA